MKFLRISNVLIFLTAIVFGVMLFSTSQAVQKKERELAKDKTALMQERETIRVLSVEWDYLNRPQRLEKLAKEQLGMQLPSAAEVMTEISQIPVPMEPATSAPELVMDQDMVHTVSTAPRPAKPAPKVIPQKAEIVSPSSAEKQSFDRLIQSLGEEEAH